MRIDFLENEEIIAQLPDIKPLMKLRMISTSLEITVAADVKNESLPQLFTVFCDNAGICKMNRGEKNVPQNNTKVFVPCICCSSSELPIS